MDAANINPAGRYVLRGDTLQDLLRGRQRVVAGPGLDYRDTADGTRTIFLASFSTSDHPYKIRDNSRIESGAKVPSVAFAPGTIDGLSPDVDGTALDTEEATLDLISGVKNILVIRATFTAATATDSGYTYMLNGGTISDPEILAYEDGTVPDDTDPSAETPAGTVYQRIGYADVGEDGVITAYENDTLRASIVSHFCAGSSVWFSSL
jgi:hypothetical protein